MKKNHSWGCHLIFSPLPQKILDVMMLSLILTFSMSIKVMASLYSENDRLDLKANNLTAVNVLKTVEIENTIRFLSDKMPENNSLVLISKLLPQQRRITGTVTDAKTGEPIAGVTVLVEGTNKGFITDASGKYAIDASDNNAILIFSFVGYVNQKLPTAGKSVIDVAMTVNTQELDEVVVTALGMSKEAKKLGFSVTQVKGADLAMTKQINPINSLQGKVAGVQIDQGAAGPFGSTRIVIRGNSTLSKNNQPIFVVDGVIVENDVVTGGRDFGNDLANLNSEDFESVSVLKGSAAAALYGSRAVNGVILITTKKGVKTDGIGVDFSQSVLVYDPYKGPKFQNEYGGGSVGAFFTDTRDPNYLPTQQWTTKVFPVDPLTGDPYIDCQINREGENWGPKFANQKVRNYDGTWTTYKAVPNNFLDAFRKGALNTTNFAFQGATDKTSFRFSYSREDQKGVIRKSGLLKNGFNLRATHQLTRWLNADVSVDYTTTDITNPQNLTSNDPFSGNSFGHAFTWVIPRNYDTKYWSQPDKYISTFGGTPQPYTNPLETNKVPVSLFWFGLYENESTQENSNLRGRFSLDAKITSWADLILEGNLNNVYGQYENKERGQNIGFAGGSYSRSDSRKLNSFAKWMLKFTNIRMSDAFKFNGFIGGETQSTIKSYTYGSTSGGLLIPDNYFVSNSILTPVVSGGTSYNKRINSLYGTADFEFKNQLFLTATMRGDWSSALTYKNGTGNNFYSYPSVSFAWIFSETFHLPEIFTFGKFRANYAALGKDTDPFIINPGYLFEGKAVGQTGDPSQATFSSTSTLAKNIKPERKIAKEIGLEMRFLKSRIGFDISLYQDNTYDQIIDISTPVESGVTGIKINAGNIQNKGIEITVDGTPIQTNAFMWNSKLTYSRNKNLIVDLGEGRSEYSLGGDAGFSSSWAVVGESYGVIRSMYGMEKYNNTANPNDPKNGLPILNWRNDARAAFPKRSNVWKNMGNINAKFRAGWSNDFIYKNWSLNVLLDAKIGGDMSLESYRCGTHSGVLANTLNGRDASHGGITWTSAYDGLQYDDGMIVKGVFAEGQQITQPDGTSANVGGMTFKEAYDAGLVEPTHAPQFYYRYASWSTGTADFSVVENSWISLRQVAISYTLPRKISTKLKMTGVTLSLIGRDLGYLYNSLPLDFNPASYNSNLTSAAGEDGFLPMIRSLGGSIKISF
jgi:iron complex outermembrane recepter protein